MRKVGGYSREFCQIGLCLFRFFLFLLPIRSFVLQGVLLTCGSSFFSYAKDFRGIAGFVLLDTFPFLGLLWDSREPLR